MNLKSFGCSFVFGCELPDDGYGTAYATPSQMTWPALLAQSKGWGYQCYARPGAGNMHIAERLLTALAATSEPDFYVVNWTWIDRFDYVDFRTDKWLTLRPSENDQHGNYYYRHFHSQFRDKFSTLSMVQLCVDQLQKRSAPFIMTYMDELMFETEYHTTPALTAMQNNIRPHMTTFDGDNFVTYSRKHGHPISDLCHPLVDAHQACYRYIADQLPTMPLSV